MEIRFYNTLSHSLERFEPLQPPEVVMYNCGPTVYDFAHIGNFRTNLFVDVLRRFLELAGYRVNQVMNLTDVGHMTEDDIADGAGEDKMQVAAKRLKEAKKAGRAPVENPDDPYQVAQYYIEAFLEDARAMRLKIADEYPSHMPRATQHIPEMQALIKQLLEKGHAYVARDGAVYYSVETFPAYGRLSGNTLDKLRGGGGGRVLELHQIVKRHPADFLLWKPDPAHLMKWDSPWGTGYPGWHIECSAMSMALTGRQVLDIHTGGEDNIFPHHECEIAQSCGATGQPLFSRYWIHPRHLLVDGQKMSKSKGNFYTVRDLMEGRATGRPVDPAVIRYELIKAHYRSNMNFTLRSLEESAGAVQKLRDMAGRLEKESGGKADPVDAGHPVLAQFTEALADDLNIAGAIGVLFKWMGEMKDSPGTALGVWRKIDEVLDIGERRQTFFAAGRGLSSIGGQATVPDANGLDATQKTCRQLDAARAAKDFATADRLRKQLIEAGYDVMTTKDGTTARRKLA